MVFCPLSILPWALSFLFFLFLFSNWLNKSSIPVCSGGLDFLSLPAFLLLSLCSFQLLCTCFYFLTWNLNKDRIFQLRIFQPKLILKGIWRRHQQVSSGVLIWSKTWWCEDTIHGSEVSSGKNTEKSKKVKKKQGKHPNWKGAFLLCACVCHCL